MILRCPPLLPPPPSVVCFTRISSLSFCAGQSRRSFRFADVKSVARARTAVSSRIEVAGGFRSKFTLLTSHSLVSPLSCVLGDLVAFARAGRCRAVPAPCPAPSGAERRLSPSRSPSSPTPTLSCTSAAASAETRWLRCVRACSRVRVAVHIFFSVCGGSFVRPGAFLFCHGLVQLQHGPVYTSESCGPASLFFIVPCLLVIARCNRTRVVEAEVRVPFRSPPRPDPSFPRQRLLFVVRSIRC